MVGKYRLFALSTCSHCKKTKELLNRYNVEYGCIDVDRLVGAEREAVLAELRLLNPALSFPTLICGDKIIIGYKEEEIKKVINRPEKLVELHATLKKLQEPKGYFFNRDEDMVFELLFALIANKDRYGYMACPCRLASSDREADRDIFCPCVYRQPDVAEYGSCYCGLYVSAAWNEGTIPHRPVPERRPAKP